MSYVNPFDAAREDAAKAIVEQKRLTMKIFGYVIWTIAIVSAFGGFIIGLAVGIALGVLVRC
jgi:hypothetical protein